MGLVVLFGGIGTLTGLAITIFGIYKFIASALLGKIIWSFVSTIGLIVAFKSFLFVCEVLYPEIPAKWNHLFDKNLVFAKNSSQQLIGINEKEYNSISVGEAEKTTTVHNNAKFQFLASDSIGVYFTSELKEDYLSIKNLLTNKTIRIESLNRPFPESNFREDRISNIGTTIIDDDSFYVFYTQGFKIGPVNYTRKATQSVIFKVDMNDSKVTPLIDISFKIGLIEELKFKNKDLYLKLLSPKEDNYIYSKIQISE